MSSTAATTSSTASLGVIPVPTLSTLGYISDPDNKFDALLAHAFVSDYNQTYLYPSNITSVPELIEAGGSNMTALSDSINTGLTRYFNKYYDSVEIDVSVVPNPVNSNSQQITFSVVIKVTENQAQFSYGRLLVTENTRLVNIINLNNNG